MIQKEDILKRLDKTAYIDMHIHPEDYGRDQFRSDILYFANAVNRESYNRILALSRDIPNIIPQFGIHPAESFGGEIPEQMMEAIFSRSVFVGEIGLDHFWVEDESTYGIQETVFLKQLELAANYKCIPSIHTKGAEEEVLEALKDYKIEKSIIHWYSGPENLIDRFLEQGCYFTIGPDIFGDSEVYRKIPENRMFAETDNPTGMPWILREKDRADDIVRVYNKLSELIPMDPEELKELFKNNLKTLLLSNRETSTGNR